MSTAIPASPATPAPVVDGTGGVGDPAPSGPRVGVRAAVVRDGAVLVNHYRAGGRDFYDLPGGGQEHGETQDDALRRECAEEIGARVRVYGIACVYELLADRAPRTGEPIPLFHQINVVRWCGLEPGETPGLGPVPDGNQVGTAWLPIAELDRHEVQPPELSAWLRSDPSSRPTWLGSLRA